MSRLLLFALILLSFHACLDQIELEVDKNLEQSIIINGELRKGTPSVIEVTISRLFNFDLVSFARIQVQSVTLIDEAGQELAVRRIGDALYRHVFEESDSIKIEYGKSYKIRVITFEGETVESAYETLHPIPPIGQLYADIDTRVQLNQREEIEEVSSIQFSIDASVKVPNEERKALLYWKAERTYQVTDSFPIPNLISKTCYVTADIAVDNILLLNGQELTRDTVARFPLSTVALNFELAEGYYYSVYQRNLTAGAFEYQSRIKEMIERGGNMFEPIAGRIPTNFVNIDDPEDSNILGFFSAYAEDTTHLYVSPEFAGISRKLCPPIDPPPFYCPAICCDCLIEPGSSVNKPDFWEF